MKKIFLSVLVLLSAISGYAKLTSEVVNVEATDMERMFMDYAGAELLIKATTSPKPVQVFLNGGESRTYEAYEFQIGFGTNAYDSEILEVEEGTLTLDLEANPASLTGTLKTYDGRQYDINLTGNHLWNDYKYGNAISLTMGEGYKFGMMNVPEENYIHMQVLGYEDYFELQFNVRPEDMGDRIPAGEYPINYSYEPGTIRANNGMLANGAQETPPFYGVLRNIGEYEVELERIYMLISGTVEVSYDANDIMTLVIDAVNSYDIPVQITYTGVGTTPKPEFEKTVTIQADDMIRMYNNEEATELFVRAINENNSIQLRILGSQSGQYGYSSFQAAVFDADGVGDILSLTWGTISVDLEAYPATISGEFIASNGVQYIIDLKGSFLFNDVQENDPIDQVFNHDINSQIGTSSTDNTTYLQLITSESMLYLAFNLDESTDMIPAGEYPINYSNNPNTVDANPGTTESQLFPSYYAIGFLSDKGEFQVDKVYLLQEGMVKVEYNENNAMVLSINATNSYGVPLHIIYDTAITDIEQVEEIENANKYLSSEGVLLIRRGEHTYTATGIRVE